MPTRSSTEVVEVAQALIRLDTTNGNETVAADYLSDYLAGAGIAAELVARDPARANLIAKLPGTDPGAPSLAFVGHLDVVPADPRDWSYPPFEAVIADDGYLYGRGAVDMKDEVAARCVAMAELARSGFRPRGDLWLIMVADEEDGAADVGMRWLLEERPDIAPTWAVNEGGGERLHLADGRTVLSVGIAEKGTRPVLLTAVGEAGHGSMPEVGDNAVPKLAELIRRVGSGLPTPVRSETVDAMLSVLLGRPVSDAASDLAAEIAEASLLHPALATMLPSLPGTTMAPTMLHGSSARNVMPARASVELDCRTLPGTTSEEAMAAVAARLGDDIAYELAPCEAGTDGNASPATGPLADAIAAVLADLGDDATMLPTLCTGFTDSVFLRAMAGTTAYGVNPFLVTPAEVVAAGFHNADERIHVDDLHYSVDFHLGLARRLLG